MSGYQGNIIIKNPATPTGPAQNGSAPGIWKLNEALAFKRQGVWPTQGIIPGDPYFNYVSLLLSTTSLGNANNNLFVDSSGAFNPISRTGNTTQGSMTPYGANWSNYFDGSGDWVQFASTSQFAIATSTTPFTIEAWIYPTAAGSCIFTDAYTGGGDNIPITISLSNGVSVDAISGRYVALGYFTGSAWVTAAKANAEVSLNTWTHIACVFTGSTFKIYYNGVDVTAAGAGSSWGMTGNSGSAWYIGRRWDIAGNDYFTGYISNLRFVNGTAVYTSAFTPPTAPLTAITNTVLLTCQSNRFRDASSNNFTPTRNGDVRVTDFSPFLSSTYAGITYDQSDITNWSGYFDGSGDDLRIASNSAFSFGTGDFTIEGWCYLSSNTGNYRVIVSIPHSSGWVQVRFGGAAEYNSLFQVSILTTAASNVYSTQVSQAAALGRWMHFAFTRSSGTCRVFLDGVQQNLGTGTNPTSFPSSSFSDSTNISNNDTVAIGNDIPNSTFYIGNLSNIRMVKGTAVYTSNFTPPTTNLTAISGTSLLTLQNAAFTDNSANNFVITPNGNTTVTGNSPFNTVGYWSNYFDGGANSLSATSANFAFGTGAWTVEFWIYPLAYGGSVCGGQLFGTTNGSQSGYSINLGQDINNFRLISNASGSWADNLSAGAGNGPSLNTWTHMAVVRSGANISIYKNGTRVATLSSAASWNFSGTTGIIGRFSDGPNVRDLNAYLSNLRVANTAIYDPTQSSITIPTAPPTAVSGTQLLTCQNGRIIDNSANALTITQTGTVSTQSFDPFYTSTIASNGGSMYFDGNGDYLLASPNPVASYSFGTNDFTIECWAYVTSLSVYGGLIDARPAANASSYAMGLWNTSGNRLDFIFTTSGTIRVTSASTFALNAWNHFAVTRSNGVIRLFINGVLDANSFTFTGAIDSGRAQPLIGAVQDPYYLNGYMSDFRITKGTALYTATFTPPSAPLTPSANTTALINGMNAGIYDAAAINDIETVGNAQVRYPTPFAPANYWAGSFDGTGDYLSVADNAALQMGSGDFTIEFWWNPSSLSGFQSPFDKGYTGSGGLLLQTGSGNGVITVYANGSAVITASTAVANGSWNHMALVRNGTSLVLYLNGASVGSATNSTNFNNTSAVGIGANATGGGGGGTYPINGFMSNVRLVKGTAVYTSNFTPSTTPLTAISGTSLLTCQNKTFIDNSTNAFTITAFGNATAGAIGPFTATGGTSVYFDGSSRLTMPPTADMDLSSGDFTVEAWVYSNTLSGTGSAATRAAAGNITSATELQWGIYRSGSSMIVRPYQGSTDFSINVGTIAANTWYHVAMTRSGNTIRGFLNGVLAGTTQTISGALNNNAAWFGVLIGGITVSGGSEYFNGYIDDLRITKGYARYTSTFTPPTQPFVTY